MQAPALRTLQTALHLPDIDGRLGPQTRNAVQAFLQQAAPDTTEDWRSWPAGRQAQLALQLQCRAAGFDPGPLDGLWGPQSRHGAEQLAYLQAHGQPPAPWRQERVPPNPNGWPLERSAELRACYGEPGEAGLVSCPLPYPLRLAWDPATRVERLRCHARVAPSLGRVLARVLDRYGHRPAGRAGPGPVRRLLPDARQAGRQRPFHPRLGHRPGFRPGSQPAALEQPAGPLRPPRVRALVAVLGGGRLGEPGPQPQLRLDARPGRPPVSPGPLSIPPTSPPRRLP